MEVAKRPFDIIAIDSIALDIVLKVEHLPGYGEKINGNLVGRLPGGPGANFACAAALLGMQTASLSTVGDDVEGQIVKDDFINYGVSTEFIHTQPGGATTFTVILIEPDGERSIIAVSAPDPAYTDDQLAAAFSQTRAIHILPKNLPKFLQIAKIARAHQTKIMIDIEETATVNRQELEAMLKWVNIASFNAQGYLRITGEAATIAGARKLLAYGPEIVVITLADKGAMAVTADASAQIDGHSVNVIDTTGAGDTFNAAFLSAILKDKPLARSLAFANAAAALSVTGLGPRGGMPTVAQVEALLAGN